MAMTIFQKEKLKKRDLEMWELYEKSIPVKKIASLYNLSRQAIYNAFHRIGKLPIDKHLTTD